MGDKRAGATAKNPRKASRLEPPAAADSGRGDAGPLEASNPREEATAAASGSERCGHYIGGSSLLETVLLMISGRLSSQDKYAVICEHCRDKTNGRKAGGGEHCLGRTTGRTIAVGKEFWDKTTGRRAAGGKHCWGKTTGRRAAGDVKEDAGKPQLKEAKEEQHWLAASYNEPDAPYCFQCEKRCRSRCSRKRLQGHLW